MSTKGALSGRGLCALAKASTTRSRISAAAFLVKVMAKICSGASTCESKAKNRCESSDVFPEPAGA